LVILFLLGAVSGYVFAFAYNKISEKA